MEGEARSRYESSIKGHIVEAMLTHCFHFRDVESFQEHLPGWDLRPGLKPAEYLIAVNYDEELFDDWVKPNGQKVLKTSSLSISLYYNGKGGRELVESWRTVKPARDYGDLRPESLPDSGTGLRSNLNRMCDNRRSVLRRLRPIELTLLNEFEKQPWKCDVQAKEEYVCPGEEIEVTLANIQDINGARSREFNRVIVQAVEGEIIGGTELDISPEDKAFLVGDGSISFTYKAPLGGEGSTDRIYVYNSCDIARDDQYPLSRTLTRDKIGEKEIRVSRCYDAIAKVTSKELVTEIGEVTHTVGSGTETRQRNYRSEEEATAHLMLEQTLTIPMIMYGEIYEYYQVKAVHLSSFKATLSDREYRYSKDSNGWSELTETWTGLSSGAKLYRPEMLVNRAQAIAVFDSETKKAKAVVLPGPGVEYTFRRDYFQEGRGEARTGPHHFTHSDEREDTKILDIGVVDGEKENLPFISMCPSPDFVVTSGDGEEYMSGSGEVTIDDCSHHNRDYTDCKTVKSYSWEFRRMKKKDAE